jgi:hypothetical protein
MRVAAAMIGFLLLGLSPSFIDWEQSPGQRGQIAAYYAVALLLLYWGLLS